MATTLLKKYWKKKYAGYLLAALLGALLAMIPEVSASSFIPLPDSSDLDIPTPTGETAIEKADSLLGPLARAARIILGALAVVFIVIAGLSMVVAGDNEENAKKQKTAATYAMVGLAMISIAGPIAEIFDFRQGNFLADPESFIERANLFDDTTQMVIAFAKYLLGGLTVLMMTFSSMKLIGSAGAESVVTQEKKNISMSAIALGMIIVSDLFVRRLFFDAEYNESTSETIIAINQNELVTQVVAATNLVVTFVGPIMMLSLVVGGVFYVTAAGDEERTKLAKKIIVNSAIGIAIIYGAFALVSTVISGVF